MVNKQLGGLSAPFLDDLFNADLHLEGRETLGPRAQVAIGGDDDRPGRAAVLGRLVGTLAVALRLKGLQAGVTPVLDGYPKDLAGGTPQLEVEVSLTLRPGRSPNSRRLTEVSVVNGPSGSSSKACAANQQLRWFTLNSSANSRSRWRS